MDIVFFLPGVFVVFCLFLILERLFHAFLFLFFSNGSGGDEKGGVFLSALQLQGAIFMYFVQSANLLVSFFFGLLKTFTTVSISYFVILIVMGIFFVFYEFSPHLLRSSMMSWNTIFGPYLYTYIVYPLRYTLSFLQGSLALFNALVFMMKRLITSFSVTALTETGNAVIDIGANAGYMFSLIGNSMVKYFTDVQNKLENCAEMRNVCFETTELELENGLKFIPEITRRVMQLFRNICPVFFFPFDILLYPLVDPNLPRALNGLINLVLNSAAETARITTQRCKLHRDDVGYIACLPDIRRMYDDFAETTRRFAAIFDNWLDMTLVILESAMAQTSPVCAEQQQRNRTFEFSDELFRGNLSTLVSLSASEIAVTDGYTIQYIDTAQSMDSVVVPLGVGWPVVVDPSLGLAAVDGLTGTVKKSILGCRCEDLEGRMEITCAIADQFVETATSAAPRLIDVSFQIPDTDKVMTCATSKISVQSVRWPSVRYTAVNEAPEIISKRRVDAAIWVMPLCLYANFACSKDAIVTSCYPYCLALHERASPSSTMVLYDAQQWEEYVHLMGRDCTYNAVEKQGVVIASSYSLMGTNTVSTIIQEAVATQMYNIRVPEEDYEITCVQSTVARSVVPKKTHASVAYKEQQNSVRTEEQPFVFAGDIALVGQYDFEEKKFSVTAMRISGNSRNEFTMQRIAEGIPANPPVETLDKIGEDVDFLEEIGLSALRQDGYKSISEDAFNDQRLITLPYRFSSSAFGMNAAVQTQGRVYYAQNPTLHIWKAFFRYCSGAAVNQNQIMIFSKYHPLVVHGVNVGFDSVTWASTVVFEDSMTNVVQADMCNNLVALAVTNLEVVDTLNIAATVLYTTISAAQDPFTDNRTRSRIFYINTRTHEKREFRPYDLPIPKQVSNDAVKLCPGLRRMPEIGSLFGEGINSVVVMPFMFVDVILQFIGKAPLWVHSTSCPLENYGHTSLQRCGREQFDLFDEFFDTVVDANEYFWRSLIHISNLIPAKGSATDTLKTQMTGIYYVGGSLSPVAGRTTRPVLNMFSVNYFSIFGRPAKSVMSAFAGQRMSALLVNSVKAPVLWGKYTMHLFTGVVGDLIPQIVNGITADAAHVLWKHLYNSKSEFTNLVTRSSLTVCEGVGMMLDGNNPMAKFLKHQCSGTVYLMDGFFTFVLAATVDTVFIACVCHESTGKSFIPFVKGNCMPHAPEHMQPILLDITNGFRQTEEACEFLTSNVNNQIENAMEPSFQEFTAAAEEVGVVFDWLRSWFGNKDAGKCIDFETDPYVAALIPEPIDYFRVCGKTKRCELKCAGVMAAFDKAVEKDNFVQAPEEIVRDVESMYFTTDTVEMYSKMDFIVSVYSSFAPPVMLKSTIDSKCVHYVYVLGKETEGDAAVHTFCIPSAPGMGVYSVDTWSIPGAGEGEKMSKGVFLDEDNVLLINVKDNSPVARLASRKLDPLVSSEEAQYHYYPVLLPENDISRVVRIMTRDRNVYIEYLDRDGEHKAVCARVAINNFLREGELVNEKDCSALQTLFQSKHVVWLENVEHDALLIPFGNTETDELTRVVRVNFAYPDTFSHKKDVGISRRFNWKLGIPTFSPPYFKQNEAKHSQRMLAQNSLSDEYDPTFKIMFVEDSSKKHHWLNEVRITPAQQGGFTGIVRTSTRQQTMKVKVSFECNRMSCSGCVRRETQIACFAMQQCMVANCIGTMINQRRPLCAIGMTLKSLLDAAIQSGRAAYLILAQTLGLAMEIVLSTKNPSYQITWPDEAFFDLICVSKDGMAHLTSIISSIVNVALSSTINLPLETISSGGRSVDANIKAIFTMISQSFNQLFFQASLIPLYMSMVLQKIVVCESNSLLALVSPDGLEVSLGHEEMRGAGTKCMPESVNTETSFIEEKNVKDNIVSSTFNAKIDFIGSAALNSVVTVIDAGISYAKGIVSGMQDVAQTMDYADCKLPDFYMNDVFSCVCGDTPMSIPFVRRVEKEENSAFWCTGTLQMIDTAGRPFIIHNPYSLYEIEDFLKEDPGGESITRLDKYLLCLSRPEKYEERFGRRDDCETLRPYLENLEAQDVDTIAVMGRCRANYQLKEWDPGAYALFTADYSVTSNLDVEVGNCLLDAQSIAQGPNACLDEFLSREMDLRYTQLDSIPKDLYFSYEYSTNTNPQHISVTTDACEVFSGPAAAGHQAMSDCLNVTGGSGCRIPPFVWSAKSNNKVPVAVTHKKTGGGDAARYETASELLERAFYDLENAFEKFNDYVNSDDQHIVAALFSAEGDFLHQVFDCAFMGALDKVDMWPLSNQGVTVPDWWRNSDGSRLFQPCTLEKLNGDPNLPFTCGSDIRRAVLKHFVRDFFPAFLTDPEKEEEEEKQKNMILELLGERIQELKKAYSFQNISDGGDGIDMETYYACICQDGTTRSFSCCKGVDSEYYVPQAIRDAKYDIIPSSNIADKLTEALQEYWDTTLRSDDVDPWWKHLDKDFKKKLYWESLPDISQAVAMNGLFSSTDGLLFFNETDVVGPFRQGNESLWHTCTGMLGQKMSTLPLKANETGFFPHEVDVLRYDSNQGDLRKFARAILREVDVESPVAALRDWRHAPSESATCKKTESARFSGDGNMRPMALQNFQHVPGLSALVDQLHGKVWEADSFKLNDKKHCFCGWFDYTQTPPKCKIPDAVFAETTLQDPVFDPLQNNDIMREVFTNNVNLTGNCPYLDFSDHWGVLTPSAAKTWHFPDYENVFMDADEVIAYGRGGLRLGAWSSLVRKEGFTLQESDRMKQFLAADGFDLSTSAFCVKSSDRQRIPSTDEGLFPIIQVVQESMPVAACSRYVVEAAKYKLLTESLSGAVSIAIAAQHFVMEKWEKTCNANLHLLSTCNHMEVLEYVPPDPPSPQAECPFTVSGPVGAYYVSNPGCIVYVQRTDAFYDPCLCMDCSSPFVFSVNDNDVISESCKVWFDIRELSQGWGRSVPENFVEKLMDRIRDDQAEGPDAFSSNEYCDSFVDWWPESWEHPVGYHVTTPCTPEEAGYRTFDNAFKIRRFEDGTAQVQYEPSALRDPDLISGHFGAGGLCRRTTYGFPMFELNDLRMCTRPLGEDRFDPLSDNDFSPGVENTQDYKCSDSGSDIPWHGVESLPGHYRVYGTIPALLEIDRLTQHLPKAGIIQDSGTTFYTNPRCYNDGECAGGRCAHNICFNSDNDIQCQMHEHCSSGQVCSADGKCVSPVVYIANMLQDDMDVEIEMLSQFCSEGSFDLTGKSAWGQIKDLLPAHGFCGYHEWYDYKTMLSEHSGSFDTWTEVWLNSTSFSQKTMEQERILHSVPHVCDRNFQYAAGYKACIPATGNTRNVSYYAPVKMNGQVDVMIPPPESDRKLSLLNIHEDNWEKITKCSDIPQCFSIPFKWNGVEKDDMFTQEDEFDCGGGMRKNSNGMCVFELDVVPFAATFCDDTKSQEAFSICNSEMEIVDEIKVLTQCALLRKEWEPIDIRTRKSAEIVNGMFQVFNVFKKTRKGYDNAAKCVNYLRDNQPERYGSQSKNLYYAFEHSLYDFPFSWWFKCSYLQTIPIIPDGQGGIECSAWDNDPGTGSSSFWMEDNIYQKTGEHTDETCWDSIYTDLNIHERIITWLKISSWKKWKDYFIKTDWPGHTVGCMENKYVSMNVDRIDECLVKGNDNKNMIDCFSQTDFNVVLNPECEISIRDTPECQTYDPENIDYSVSLSWRDLGKYAEGSAEREALEKENMDLMIVNKLRTLIGDWYREDEFFTDNLEDNKIISQCKYTGPSLEGDSQPTAKATEEWEAWAEEHAQPIDECHIDTLEYGSWNYGTLPLFDPNSNLDDVLEKGDYLRNSGGQKWVENLFKMKFGKFAGGLAEEFVQAATLSGHKFSFGDIVCGKTGKLKLETTERKSCFTQVFHPGWCRQDVLVGSTYQEFVEGCGEQIQCLTPGFELINFFEVPYHTVTSQSYEDNTCNDGTNFYRGRKMEFCQIDYYSFYDVEDNPEFFNFEGYPGPVDFLKKQDYSGEVYTETYPCSTSSIFTQNTRTCQMHRKGKKISIRRYDCTSDAENSEENPGVEKIQFEQNGETKTALVPKAMCVDNYDGRVLALHAIVKETWTQNYKNASFGDTSYKFWDRGNNGNMEKFWPTDQWASLNFDLDFFRDEAWLNDDDYQLLIQYFMRHRPDFYVKLHESIFFGWTPNITSILGEEMRLLKEDYFFIRALQCEKNPLDSQCQGISFSNMIHRKKNAGDAIRYEPKLCSLYEENLGSSYSSGVSDLQGDPIFLVVDENDLDCSNTENEIVSDEYFLPLYGSITCNIEIPKSRLCECYYSAENLYESGIEGESAGLSEPINTNRAVYTLFLDPPDVSTELCKGKNRCALCYTEGDFYDFLGCAFDGYKESVTGNMHMFSAISKYMDELKYFSKVTGQFTKNTESKIYSDIENERQSFQIFDPTDNIVHDYFIKRNMMDQVRCSTKEATKIEYDQCNYDERLRDLEKHVVDNYIESSQHILNLQKNMSGSFAGFDLLKGAILAFQQNMGKSQTENHMKKIERLEEGRCIRGAKSVLETYCYLGSANDTVKPLNPWLGGHYNPIEGCDTQIDSFGREVIDGSCDAQVCTDDAFSAGTPAGLTCFSRDDQMIVMPRIADSAANNLCKEAAEFVTGECTQEFGLLGGGKGSPTPDLYEESNFSCSEKTTTFFTPVGVNTLFYGAEIEDACLQFAADEMGPHAIWMEMSEKRGEKRLQIKAVQIAAAENEAPEKERWYFLLHDNCHEDLKTYDKIYSGTNWTATTPYERISFWQGGHLRGKPVTPDPSRSIIFHQREEGYLAGCGGANPLQGIQKEFGAIADQEMWRTVDGVHFCSPADIQNCKNTFLASKESIISAVMFPSDNVELEARAITPQESAGNFWDWPKRGGVYRDGGNSSHEFIRTIHSDIVSRLPSFHTKASLSKKEVRKRATQGTTLSEGGDCHLGRAMRQDTYDDFSVSDCYMVSKNKDELKFECIFNGVRGTKTFPRERSRTPYEAQEHMKTKRKKCSQCSVPTFEPSGNLDEHESSFGTPFRFAPSRRILRGVLDLMREYNATNTLGTETSQEDRSRFVNEYLRADAREVVQKQKETGDAALDRFRELFAQPWVFCNDTGCSGNISYDTWVSASPGGRLSQCRDKLLQETNNGEDLVVNMEICDIDSRLDETCRLMRSAQQLIFDANCHAAGLCEDDTFVYAPAVYSISNNDFVRMSVRSFYLRHESEVEICTDEDKDNEMLREQNEVSKGDCASTSIAILQELLDQLREASHMIARMAYYLFNLIASIFRLIYTTNHNQASESLLFWTNKFLEEFNDFIKEVFNIISRIIFDETRWGQALLNIMREVCNVLKTVWDIWVIVYCNIISPAISKLIEFFDELQKMLEQMINWIPLVNEEVTFLDPFLDFFRGILGAANDFTCGQGEWNCSLDFGGDGTEATGTLPLPSRCWADFVPFAGISTALSCSRSDTCLKDALGSELVVCDSCPVQGDQPFNDYGCNLVTKKCSCKTQPRTVTFCTDNSQCSMDASCLLIDNVFSPQAWGVDLCSYCSAGGMCVFEEPGTIGKCGCPYTLPTIQTCSPGSVGQRVRMDPTQSCYFSSSDDISYLSTKIVSKNALSLTPCAYLDPTKTVCLQVDSIPRVVGYGFVRDSFNGRRLLSSSSPVVDFVPPDIRGLASELLEDANWNTTMQPCRSLVAAHREQKELGPVDTYVLQKCVFWRTVANRTGGIPDTLLLSWSDAFDLFYNDPAVLLSGMRSVVNITREVIGLWPEGREFLLGLNALWVSRNDSWLIAAKTYIQENAVPKRKLDSNFETYLNISKAHRRHMMEAPRIEDLTDAKIAEENEKTTENLKQVFESNDIPTSLINLLGEPIRSVSLFRASGFDDFMKTRQYDPVKPNQKYWRDTDNDGNLDWETCPVIAEVFDETKRVTNMLSRYYTYGVYRPKGQWKVEGLTKGLKMAKIQRTLPTWKVPSGKSSWPRDILKGIIATLESFLGFSPSDLVALFSCTRDTDVFTLCNYGRKMFVCDQEAVQTCSKREVSPYMGMLFSVLLIFSVSFILSAVMVPFSTPLLFMILLPFFFVYTYSYSIACIPAVPVCLLEDIIFPVFYFIPRNFGMSDNLQEVPGCWNNTNIPAEKCLKSCAFDEEFNYISYSALYAQVVCEFYGKECNNPERFMPPEWLHWFIDPNTFKKDLKYKAYAQWQYTRTPVNEDPLIAQRFCALYGALMYVPILILLSVALLVLFSLPSIISSMAVFSVQVFIHILYFTYMSDE